MTLTNKAPNLFFCNHFQAQAPLRAQTCQLSLACLHIATMMSFLIETSTGLYVSSLVWILKKILKERARVMNLDSLQHILKSFVLNVNVCIPIVDFKTFLKWMKNIWTLNLIHVICLTMVFFDIPTIIKGFDCGFH